MEINNDFDVFFNKDKVLKIYLNGQLVYGKPTALILYDNWGPIFGIAPQVEMIGKNNVRKGYLESGDMDKYSFAEWVGKEISAAYFKPRYEYNFILAGQNLSDVTNQIEEMYFGGNEYWSDETMVNFGNYPAIIATTFCYDRDAVNNFIGNYVSPYLQAWLYLKFDYAGWAEELNKLLDFAGYLNISDPFQQIVVVGTAEETERFVSDLTNTFLSQFRPEFIDYLQSGDSQYIIDESLLLYEAEQELKDELLYNLIEPREADFGRCFYLCLDTRISNAMESIMSQRDDGLDDYYEYNGGRIIASAIEGAGYPSDTSRYAALVYYDFAEALSKYAGYYAQIWERDNIWDPPAVLGEITLEGDPFSLYDYFVPSYKSDRFYI